MADILKLPEEAQFQNSAFPQLVKNVGSNFPIFGLAYDAAADEEAFWKFKAVGYTSGNITLNIMWYADTASSGDVIFDGRISVITPNTDTQDIETDAFATANSVTDSHLGTTNQRLHEATITISNLDSLSADDWVVLGLNRDANNGSDTMAGDAIVTLLHLSYS